jgi:adenylosuccinate synthase
MRTFQEMRMNVDYMMEQMRINAINDTFEKFKKASRHYYETSDGGSEVTKLIKELEELGANMEYVIEVDLQIRDEVFGL